jgi:hypothetical protein
MPSRAGQGYIYLYRHLPNVDMTFTDSGSYFKKGDLKKRSAREAYETEIPTPI